MVTFHTGMIRYIKKSITTSKPPQYRINVLNTVIHSVFRSYHPVITEPVIVSYQAEQTKNCSEVNHRDLHKGPMTNNTL